MTAILSGRTSQTRHWGSSAMYSAPAVVLHEAEHQIVAGNQVLGHIPKAALRALIGRSTLLLVDARKLLFAQGDTGNTVLVVLQGYLKLSATTVGGRETILDIAGPGELFGEIAVLNGWPRAADATTLSACRLLSIDGREFSEELKTVPESLLAVIRLLSERLRTTTAQMTDVVDLSVPARIAKALRYLAALHSHSDNSGVHIELQLTQRELGALTGLMRESVNKHLGLFRDAGAIRINGQEITIVDLDKLVYPQQI
jgi:CRP/FNR family transcriptional regulator, cyclic AMP receptor protein